MTISRAIVLCLLVVLAGCTGPADQRPGDGVDDPPLPPGVAQDDVNASALFDAHAESLTNRSFTLQYEVSSNEWAADVVGEVGANHRRAAVRIEKPNSIEEFFVTSEVSYEFDRSGNRTRYSVVNRSGTASSGFVRRYVRPIELESLVAAGEWTTDGTTDCAAGTCWVLRATGVSSSGEPADADDLDGRITVAPSGRVVRATVTADVPDDTIEISTRVTDVGTTTVERPEWVSTANRTGTRIGFDRGTTPEPAAPRIEGEFFDRNGSVAVVGVDSDADYSNLETHPIASSSDNPLVNATVGWFVGVDFTGPYEFAVVRLDYNETRIPEGGTESELALYRLNDTTGRFERLDAARNPADDMLAARVENVTGIYAVFHEPTFERIRNETRT